MSDPVKSDTLISSTAAKTAAFFTDLDETTAPIRAVRGLRDVRHLRILEAAGRGSALLGYACSWTGINPLSIIGLALAIFVRWTIVAHLVLHRGYDNIPETPKRLTSRHFARGRRRIVDWLDWISVKEWCIEHNILHHFRVGEDADPDLAEANTRGMRSGPSSFRLFVAILTACTWRFFYVGPNVIKHAEKHPRDKPIPFDFVETLRWMGTTGAWRQVLQRAWLPCLIGRFVLLPLPFLLVGLGAWASALANLILAEALANFYSYFVVVSSHAGADVFRFTGPVVDENERRLRQIIATVNYYGYGSLGDFFMGYMNYQIEHHLWPDLTLFQYKQLQPVVKKVCLRNGIPYHEDFVWRRGWRMLLNTTFDEYPMLAVGDAYKALESSAIKA